MAVALLRRLGDVTLLKAEGVIVLGVARPTLGWLMLRFDCLIDQYRVGFRAVCGSCCYGCIAREDDILCCSFVPSPACLVLLVLAPFGLLLRIALVQASCVHIAGKQ
jgi:hypothetical protein